MALTLKAMHYFTTAVRHGNIANAAIELNIAASAISTAIDQVEAEFDLTLVTRQRARGIQATTSGRDIVQKCERLLDEYQSILAEGADLKKSVSGRLKIGYYAPIAPAFLPHILDTCAPKGADVRFDLDECDNDQAQTGLIDGTYDVILFVAQDVRPSIGYDTLISAPPYCLLPAHHALGRQKSVTMAQIAKEPLVVLNRPVAASYYEGLFEPGTRQAPIAAYAGSTEMVRSLVASGRGLAILSMRPQTSDTYGGAQVIERPISDALPPLTLAIGYNKARPRRLVLDFARACSDFFASPRAHHYILDKAEA